MEIEYEKNGKKIYQKSFQLLGKKLIYHLSKRMKKKLLLELYMLVG